MKATHVIIILLAGLCLWLLKCYNKTQPVPDVIPVKDQEKVVLIDSAHEKRVVDSLYTNFINPARDSANYWYVKYVNEYNDGAIQADHLTDLVNQKCPDTTGEIKASLRHYIATNKATKTACDSTIKYKDRIISGQQLVIAEKDTALTKHRASLRVAFEQQDKLANHINSLQPRGQFYAGVTVSGNPKNYLNSIGPSLGYKTKKGFMIEAGALFFNGTQYTLGVKKIISFNGLKRR